MIEIFKISLNHIVKVPLHWDRSTRDTVFILSIVVLTFLPMASNVPLLISIMVFGLVLWRFYLTMTAKPMPSKWLIFFMLLAILIGIAVSYQSLIGRDPAVALLMVLLAFKTFELNSDRDVFLVFFLSFFCLMTHFLFSQSIITTGFMLLTIWALFTALVNANRPVGMPPLWQSAKMALKVIGIGTPFSLALFLLFPRIDPLWGMPGKDEGSRTGLSNELSMGQIASLSQDDTVVARLTFQSQVPKPSELYFRGPVLDQFDGKRWTASETSALTTTRPNLQAIPVGGATPILYTSLLHRDGFSWVLPMDYTASIMILPSFPNQQLTLSPNMQWQLSQVQNQTIRYSARAYPYYRYGLNETPLSLKPFLELPPNANPKTRQWITELKKNPVLARYDGQQWQQWILHYIQNQNFIYTLDPGVLPDENTIDAFWLKSRRGFCEHYAASFVFLMRALGVPSRIVLGYQGAEYNPIDQTWLIRQRHAHAWTEVWYRDRGWVRVDPTRSIAPNRIEMGTLASSPTQVFGIDAPLLQSSLFKQLRQMWDAADGQWQGWLYSYTEANQMNWLKKIGFDFPDTTALLQAIIAVSILFFLFLYLVFGRRPAIQDPWQRVFQGFCRKIQKQGHILHMDVTPRQLIEAIRGHVLLVNQPEQAVNLLSILEQLRYRQPKDGIERSSLQLKNIKRGLQNVHLVKPAPDHKN